MNVFDDLYDLISLQLLIYFSVFYVIDVTARFTIAPTNGMAHLMATEKRRKEDGKRTTVNRTREAI